MKFHFENFRAVIGAFSIELRKLCLASLELNIKIIFCVYQMATRVYREFKVVKCPSTSLVKMHCAFFCESDIPKVMDSKNSEYLSIVRLNTQASYLYAAHTAIEQGTVALNTFQRDDFGVNVGDTVQVEFIFKILAQKH